MAVKTQFKVPEGRYMLHTEKTSGLVPFAMRRATRLSVCTLHNGAEEGMYMVYNVHDYLHITPFDATEKEPLVSLIFNPAAVRDGYPCCHAYSPAKDGLDLVVGIANGEVLLLSLRAQLQLPSGSTRPALGAQLNTDNAHDSSRANVVLWVPRSSGAQFLVGHGSGTILVYKKTPAMTGEGSGKLLSHLSNKQSSSNPCQTITSCAACGGVNDAAFSPDGSKLAVASRDGSVRLLDWPSGACVAGYQSYYGAALCVCWSPDAAFVASGGEDDLVAAYSVADRQVVAFGEGHASWVSRVAFDPWTCGETTTSAGPPGSPAPQLREKLYRLGSVGQDTSLCLWDLVLEEEPPGFNAATGTTSSGLKRVASQSQVAIPSVSSSANLASQAQQQASLSQAAEHSAHSQPPSSHPSPGHSRSVSDGGLAGFSALAGGRTGSGNLLSLLKQPSQHGGAGGGLGAAPVAPSMPRGDMMLLPPVMQQRIHLEPVSDVVFTEEAIFTACSGGQIKCWLRPHVAEEMAAEQQQLQQQRAAPS